MRYLSIKNYASYQHYKDRRPPWIKLHAAVLDDYAFGCLQDASKAHLLLLWVLASKLDNRIPWDEDWLAKQLMATSPVDIEVLVKHGFVVVEQDAGEVLASRKQDAVVETEAEAEAETKSEEEQTHPEQPAALAIVPTKGKSVTRASRAVRVARTGEEVKARIVEYLDTVDSTARSKRDTREFHVEVVFAYWSNRHGHPRAILDPKRVALISKRLDENKSDLSELLFAIDGALRDKHLTENGYDMLTTILRDRQQVERLAGLVPKYRRGELHNMARKALGIPETDAGATPSSAAQLQDHLQEAM